MSSNACFNVGNCQIWPSGTDANHSRWNRGVKNSTIQSHAFSPYNPKKDLRWEVLNEKVPFYRKQLFEFKTLMDEKILSLSNYALNFTELIETGQNQLLVSERWVTRLKEIEDQMELLGDFISDISIKV